RGAGHRRCGVSAEVFRENGGRGSSWSYSHVGEPQHERHRKIMSECRPIVPWKSCASFRGSPRCHNNLLATGRSPAGNGHLAESGEPVQEPPVYSKVARNYEL